MKDEKNISTENENSKIDAIKQLIFGEQIQTYDSEFEALKKDILEKQKLLEDLVETVRTELTQSIDSLATDLNIRITEIEDKVQDKIDTLDDAKVDRKMLGELLTKLGEKISQ